MADAPRPAFRPQRTRASLGAVPSASYALASPVNKENPSTSRDDSTTPAPGSDAPASQPSTAQKRTKKRAQSLGGDALEMARKRLQLGEPPRLEMSPGKLERRQRVRPQSSCALSVTLTSCVDPQSPPLPARRHRAAPSSSRRPPSSTRSTTRSRTRPRSTVASPAGRRRTPRRPTSRASAPSARPPPLRPPAQLLRPRTRCSAAARRSSAARPSHRATTTTATRKGATWTRRTRSPTTTTTRTAASTGTLPASRTTRRCTTSAGGARALPTRAGSALPRRPPSGASALSLSLVALSLQ